MVTKEQLQQEAKDRQAVLESKFNPQELKQMRKYNPQLAQSFLFSAQLREAIVKVK